MFLSGLEIDFSIFKQKGKKIRQTNQIHSGSKHYLLIYFHLILCPIIVFVWLGFVDNAMFMTLIISTISLGVVYQH